MANSPTVKQLITRTARRSRRALPTLNLYLEAAKQASFPDAHIEALEQLIAEMSALMKIEHAEFEVPERRPGPVPASRPKTTDFTRHIFESVVPKKPRKKKTDVPKVIAKIIAKDFTDVRQLEAAEAISVNEDGEAVIFNLGA